jgi:antirestriction protein ArdC
MQRSKRRAASKVRRVLSPVDMTVTQIAKLDGHVRIGNHGSAYFTILFFSKSLVRKELDFLFRS